MVYQHVQDAPVPPSQLPEGHSIPQELDGLVMRSLAKDPDDRFQSAEEMRGLVQYALQMLQDQGPNTGTWNTGPVTMSLPHGQPGGAATTAMPAGGNGGPRPQYNAHATTSQFQQPMVPPLNPDDGTAFPGGGGHGGHGGPGNGHGGYGGYDGGYDGRRGGRWKMWVFALLAVLAIAGGVAYAVKTGGIGKGDGGKPGTSQSSPGTTQSSPSSTPDTPSNPPSTDSGGSHEETFTPTPSRTKYTPTTSPSSTAVTTPPPDTKTPTAPQTTPPTKPPTTPPKTLPPTSGGGDNPVGEP